MWPRPMTHIFLYFNKFIILLKSNIPLNLFLLSKIIISFILNCFDLLFGKLTIEEYKSLSKFFS